MKSGRVITGDELDARARAQAILDDAKREAAKILADAQHRHVEEARLAAEPSFENRDGTAVVQQVAVGAVDSAVGLVIHATIAGVALGEVVKIARRGGAPLPAEVVGFRGEQAIVLPLGDLAGVAPAAANSPTR